MALGTPVAAAAAYSASGGTSVAPAYPSGILATDAVLLFVGQKPSTANGGTVTTPAGWTLREELTGAGGYGTTLGADTGNTNLRVYSWDTPIAGQTGTRSVTLGGNGVSWAFIVRIPTGGGTISYGSADGQRTTTPTSPMSIALTNGATATNFQAGDKAIWAMCIPTDVTTPSQFSAEAVTATGAVFATATEMNEPDSTTGNDIGGYSAYAHVNSGSSTTAPTVTATLAGTLTNVRGPVVLLRVREAQALTLDAQPGSFTYTGQDATLAHNQVANAEAGAFSYTGEDATLTVTAAAKEIDAQAGSFSYTGQAATLAKGSAVNAASGAYSYNGQAATLNRSYSFNAESGTFSYAGQAATLNRTYAANAEAGSFSYTGEPATLTVVQALNIDAAAGSFSYTGQDATLAKGSAVNAAAGSFSYTGQDAAFAIGLALNAEAGSFGITGADANLIEDEVISAEAGTFGITGQDATLGRSYSFNAEAGSFDYVGQNTTLSLGIAVNLEAGSFSYTGQNADFSRTQQLNALAGVFSNAADDLYTEPGYVNPDYATGLEATLSRSLVLSAAEGAFTLTGQPATLVQGQLYPNPSDVRAGVVYGPGGIYTGTLVVSTTKPIYLFDD